MSVKPEVAASPAELSSFREVSVEREQVGAVELATDYVAEERPVALHYYRLPYVVMLASPADLEDLGVGFTLSEGIVGAADEIRGVELVRDGRRSGSSPQLSRASASPRYCSASAT